MIVNIKMNELNGVEIDEEQRNDYAEALRRALQRRNYL